MHHLSLITIWGIFNSPILMGLLLGHDSGRPVITLKNPITAAIRKVPLGWNWWLFLSLALYGMPLFYSRLHLLGIIFLFLPLMAAYLDFLSNYGASQIGEPLYNGIVIACIIFVFVIFFCQIWLGKKGSEIAVKSYLKKGWVFTDPESAVASRVRKEWNLA